MPRDRRDAILLDMIATAAQSPIPFVADQLAALRIFIADDRDLYRQVVARAVDRHPGLALADEASDGETALAGILNTAPDVALPDLRMPGPRRPRSLRAPPSDGIRPCVLSRERPRVHAEVVGAARWDAVVTPRKASCRQLTMDWMQPPRPGPMT